MSDNPYEAPQPQDRPLRNSADRQSQPLRFSDGVMMFVVGLAVGHLFSAGTNLRWIGALAAALAALATLAWSRRPVSRD
jgi:hypothetical protein